MKKNTLKLAVVFLLAVLIVPIVVGLLPSADAAKQQSSAEIKQEISKMEQEQAELEDKLKELEKLQSENQESLTEMVAQKNVLDQQVSLLNDQLNNISERIAQQMLLIANKQIELENARADLELMRQMYKARIRAMEEGGTVSYWSVIFEASDFSELLDRINMIQEIAEADTKRIEALDRATREVEESKLALDEERRNLEKNKEEMEAKQVQLGIKQEEANAVLNQLLAKGKEYEDLVEQAEEAKNQMQDRLDAMEIQLTEAEKREAEEELRRLEEEKKKQEAANNNNNSSSGPINGALPIHTDKNGITWQEPCEYGRVSSPFGMRADPFTGKQTGHNGVDLTRPKWAVNSGAPVPIYAVRSGKVVYAGWDDGGGNYVSIDHLDGYKSQYMHLKSIEVKNGQTVLQGQLIGYMGTSGQSTGIHLHFTIRLKNSSGKYIHQNPANYIKFR